MDENVSAQIVSALSKQDVDGSLSYGTAGFRARADRLTGALLRVGVFAALRSASLGGRSVGVMVTASHNPAADNGAKIVDPSGAMLAPEWEARAAAFVNDPNPASALAGLSDLINVSTCAVAKASVILGSDTRPTSKPLVEQVKNGALAVNSTSEAVRDLGVVTTPQLHFVVRAKDRDEPDGISDYYSCMIRQYHVMLVSHDKLAPICVDCANGVGSIALTHFDSSVPGLILVNRAGDGDLNFQCGADFVQKKRLMPTLHGKQDGIDLSTNAVQLWASLDGDADRLVMYSTPADGSKTPDLADGDRFAGLAAMFVSKHLERAGLTDVVVGVAQTAYSNGAATEYLESLRGVQVVMAKTGVKHLEKAIHPFDIGIYWEPNGHGTVLYSDLFVERLTKTLAGNGSDASAQISTEMLLSVGRIANQAVGDGIADLLLVRAILASENMSFSDWLNMYTERCSENLVVRVADKNVISTEDCDRKVTHPPALRAAIEQVSSGRGRRAFVRPSGTEDVVRIYAEAPPGCEADAKGMARSIALAVYDTCNGVGQRM